ncbi:MAG: 3-isopropylmalate dehydratase small subunit [Bacilli bacterium]|nr:3-isopropylmalate dehydratase small subunit [Bacilli bacterium]
MKVEGKVIKYGNNVDTDVIIPARYLNTIDKKELASHCMEDLDKDFLNKISKGDIMVAGKNFGCGSSREHAPIAIKESGISLIIAESFARIFYRNSINIGLPIIESVEAAQDIKNGDELVVDFDKGIVKNVTKNKEYKVPAFPVFVQKIITNNGLVEMVKSGELNK